MPDLVNLGPDGTLWGKVARNGSCRNSTVELVVDKRLRPPCLIGDSGHAVRVSNLVGVVRVASRNAGCPVAARGTAETVSMAGSGMGGRHCAWPLCHEPTGGLGSVLDWVLSIAWASPRPCGSGMEPRRHLVHAPPTGDATPTSIELLVMFASRASSVVIEGGNRSECRGTGVFHV